MTIVNLSPTADVQIYAGAPTTNYNSDTENLISGDRQFFDIYRSLIQFGIVAGVPAGATINSVSLKLTQHAESHSGSGSTTHSLYPLLVAWVEGEATWNIRSTGNNWTAAGGFSSSDCSQTSIADLSLSGIEGSGVKTWTFNATGIARVQDILDSVVTNYGFLLKSQTESDDGHHFRPREYTTEADRPVLTIDYTEGGGGDPEGPLVRGKLVGRGILMRGRLV